MTAFSVLRVLVIVVLLVASTEPSPIQLFGYVDVAGLFSRQDTLDSASCVASCDLNTCGSSISCNAISKRDLSGGPFSNSSDTHALGKRLFATTADGKVYSTGWTNKLTAAYLPSVWNGMDDAYYNPCLETVSGVDETPVSQQMTFGTAPFQIISGGIHGCTIVVVVSTRGVWMAHFWESYSNGKDAEGNNNDNPNDQAFNQRVLMFMQGQVVPPGTAVDNGWNPYIPPLPGSAIDPDLFNLPRTDRTVVYIFTPFVGASGTALKYPNRYGKSGEVVTTITNILVTVPEVEVIGYRRLNKNLAADADLINNVGNRVTSRGYALFQFDPNSNGNGFRAWRMFLENRVTTRNVAALPPN